MNFGQLQFAHLSGVQVGSIIAFSLMLSGSVVVACFAAGAYAKWELKKKSLYQMRLYVYVLMAGMLLGQVITTLYKICRTAILGMPTSSLSEQTVVFRAMIVSAVPLLLTGAAWIVFGRLNRQAEAS